MDEQRQLRFHSVMSTARLTQQKALIGICGKGLRLSVTLKTDNPFPIWISYGMMNVACINSYIIYYHNTFVQRQTIMYRRDFMRNIHSQLVEPGLKILLANHTMPTHIKISDISASKNDGSQGQRSRSSRRMVILYRARTNARCLGLNRKQY